MAFIRAYAEAGDPFRFHIPKRVFKIKAARFKGLGRIARAAAGFIPGVGGLVDAASGISALAQRAARTPIAHQVMQEYASAVEEEASPEAVEHYTVDSDNDDEFARGYGEAYGDPVPIVSRPSHRPVNTHPAHAPSRTGKSSRKSKVTKGRKVSPSHVPPGHAGGSAKQVLDAIGANLPLFGPGFKIGLGVDAQGRPVGAGRFGGHRRRINATNVKALKRGLRRVEAFEKVVASVHKAYPRLKHTHATHHRSHRRPKGHKPGCGCVACR